MDDGSDLDGKVAAAKKKWRTASAGVKAAEDDQVAATSPPRPRRSAKKRVVYFTKSDSEMESDEDGDEAPKKGSAKKKSDESNGKGRGKKASKGGGGKKRISIDSDSDQLADACIVAPADLSSLPLALLSSLTDKSMDFDEDSSLEMEFDEDSSSEMEFGEDSSSEMEFDVDSSSEMKFNYFIVRPFDDAAKKADEILNNTLAQMKKQQDKGPTTESETAYLVTLEVELFRLGYGLISAKCKRDDLGRHVYEPQPLVGPASKSAGCYKVQVAGGNNKKVKTG